MDPLALLLDLGGTVFRAGSEMMGVYGERVPAVRAVVARRGPHGPEPDPLWDDMLAGRITERDYWGRRAAELGRALGADWGVQDLMHALYSLPDEDLMRPEAAELIADARAAGLAVGVLSNDLVAFHGDRAMARHPFLAEVDALIDGSVTGVLKPDPRAYALAADALGRSPGDIVFIDDMPWNVAGAAEAGMIALQLDLMQPGAVFDVARDLLRLRRRAA